jgi:hypothetical protein
MLREDYRFSYAENNTTNPLSYHAVNENKHWLSVLNFQANFEQRLNSRLSIGLQPYLKIPLSNIGFAGVKLQSLGGLATNDFYRILYNLRAIPAVMKNAVTMAGLEEKATVRKLRHSFATYLHESGTDIIRPKLN